MRKKDIDKFFLKYVFCMVLYNCNKERSKERSTGYLVGGKMRSPEIR